MHSRMIVDMLFHRLLVFKVDSCILAFTLAWNFLSRPRVLFKVGKHDLWRLKRLKTFKKSMCIFLRVVFRSYFLKVGKHFLEFVKRFFVHEPFSEFSWGPTPSPTPSTRLRYLGNRLSFLCLNININIWEIVFRFSASMEDLAAGAGTAPDSTRTPWTPTNADTAAILKHFPNIIF